MAKYNVSIPYHATIHIEVEADSKEEAEEVAMDNCYPTLCNYCSSDGIELDEANYESEIYISEVE